MRYFSAAEISRDRCEILKLPSILLERSFPLSIICVTIIQVSATIKKHVFLSPNDMTAATP